MASARTAESGSGAKPETTRASTTTKLHEYLVRRYSPPRETDRGSWVECGSITAANPRAALTAYGEQHAGEIAELATDGDVILEAISTRYRGVKRANPTRQLVIKWEDA